MKFEKRLVLHRNRAVEVWTYEGKRYAVKSYKNYEEEKDDILLEMEMQLILDHPGILKPRAVLQGKTEDTARALIFDYVETKGEPRKLYPKLSTSEIKKVMLGLLDVVAHCHENSILHGDIKPENMLIDSSLAVKLIDFEYAQAMTTPEIHSSGTRFYFSPERLHDVPCHFAADMWSCGMTLLVMLCPTLTNDADTNSKQLAFLESILGSSKFKAAGFEPVKNHRGKGLTKLVQEHTKRGDSKLMYLLQALLQVDPRKRPTAREAIALLK